jgi:hypothetical protein
MYHVRWTARSSQPSPTCFAFVLSASMPPYTLYTVIALATSVLADSTITAAPSRRTAYADVGADIARRQAPASSSASASPLPLTAYKYEYDQLPYQVNPYEISPP